MIVLLSPAKSLDLSEAGTNLKSLPRLQQESVKLANKIRRLSGKKLQELMGISEKLADTTRRRFDEMEENDGEGKQALLMFKGDVFQAIKAEELEKEELEFAQKHVRILSGLYGLLRPMDVIHPYRLEMGTPLKVGRKKNLYDFWGDQLTELLKEDLKKSGRKAVINLASKEYYSAIDTKKLDAPVYDIHFREWRGEKLRPIHIFLKRARGYMTRYIIENQIDDPEKLKGFDWHEYNFDADRSEPRSFLFTRIGKS